MKTLLALGVLFCSPLAAFCQAGSQQPESVAEAIQAVGGVIGAPNHPVWTPDSRKLTYLDHNGDLLAVDPSTAKVSVLVERKKLEAVMNAHISEKDRDHRNRYHTANYIFSADSRHVLFDEGGEMWNYDLSAGTVTDLGSTGAGSGDDPKFAPSAEKISYIKGHNLHVRDISGGHELNLSNVADSAILNGEVDWVYEEELDTRSNYFWSPDSKNLAYLQANETKVPQYPLVDWDPTHATVEQQRYPQPGDPNPDVRIGVVAASGGATHWMKIPMSANNDYIPRFGWVDAHTVWIEVLRRDHQHLEIYFADARTGESRRVLAMTDDKFFDESYDVTFLKKSPEFLLTSWSDGHTHIYRYHYDGAHPMAADATIENELERGDYEADIAGVEEAAQTVLYHSNESDPRIQQIWSVKYDGSEKHKISASLDYHEATVSPDGAHYADEASSISILPSMNMCNAQGNCTAYWNMPPMQGRAVRSPEQLVLRAADGTTLYGTLLMPEGATNPASVPLLNNPYGGPHANSITNRFSPVNLLDELFASHGFAVLHVDNRGMGGRGRTFETAAYRNFGPVQFADQMAAIDQVLASHPQLDGKRMGWWGWSWGGTFTLYAMTHSDRFRAGIDGGPVTDWRNYDSIYTERYMGLPSENADAYKTMSVVNYAQDLKGHLLMVHGTMDDNVHMANTIQFVQQLVNHNVPYDLQLYPNVTHSLGGYAEHLHYYERALQHFETYLK